MRRGQAPCAKCGTMIDMETSEQPTPVNLNTTSVLIVEHSGQVVCPNCKTVVKPTVLGVQGVMIAMVPVPVKMQPNLIVPAGGAV